MTRRLLLLLPAALCLRAGSEKDAEALIATAAGGLSADQPGEFLSAFDPHMPGYDKLRESVTGLTREARLSVSVEVLESQGDDDARTLTLDWILRMDYRDDRPGYVRRQKTVTCKLRKSGKKWRIVAFDPLDLFASPGS